ncbi:alpha/beta hydrolase [Pseudomonas paeninsulae]|uniref:alpha/beta hydrolase n=1 Tax=Pseudomonas paeninsulae TaxID=3110772 RepID=UPI002D78B7A3|nr:alpha/beta hydrolase [Pseudomonas sp. IT1137]
MKTANLGPLRRVGVWLQGAALLLGAALSGCQSPHQALQALASRHAVQLETLPTLPFPLTVGIPPLRPMPSRIRIYLEGDGRAWATSTQPSLDPSPRHLLVAGLAFGDPTPSLYLARPCQFVTPLDCRSALWTDRRFSKEVLDSLDQALTLIKTRYGNQDFELVGYSGGAALALLLAVRRDDIALVQTLAGNLSPRQWASLHGLSPLNGSLEPLDQRQRLAQIPQRHLFGADDRVVPPVLLQRYREAMGTGVCLQSAVLPEVSHSLGWEQVWPAWREQPLDCVRD